MSKSKMIKLLNETYGIDLSDEDEFYIEGIQIKLNENRDLKRSEQEESKTGYGGARP